ncbi:MAG: hypothetical protein MPK62_00905 [Alphaproteobacteria bacterium]|nr:hypothetical protein [Alphaproteobacteria bacterium]
MRSRCTSRYDVGQDLMDEAYRLLSGNAEFQRLEHEFGTHYVRRIMDGAARAINTAGISDHTIYSESYLNRTPRAARLVANRCLVTLVDIDFGTRGGYTGAEIAEACSVWRTWWNSYGREVEYDELDRMVIHSRARLAGLATAANLCAGSHFYAYACRGCGNREHMPNTDLCFSCGNRLEFGFGMPKTMPRIAKVAS